MRPQEEQPQWRGSSGNLDSAPAVTPELSVCRAWRLWGGAADLLSSGQECPWGPGPSRPLPVPGEAGSWAVSRRPVLRRLRCWIRAPCRVAPSAEQPPEPIRAAPGPAVRAAALRELGALSWARSCFYCPGEPEGIPSLLGPAPTPREPLSAQEGRCSSCVAGTGLPCTGDTRPGLSPAPRGAPPPWMPFVSLFLFPRLLTLIEARTLLTVAFQLVSL